MCTVTYIPLANRVLLSSSRDEVPTRKPAALPSFYKGENKTSLYPADGAAGGTWIGLNTNGDVLILLNGGIVDHVKEPPYRLSRGLIVKQLLDVADILTAWENLNLNNIEPFTLIVFVKKELHQLVWNGLSKIASEKDPSHPQIWSSSTLYGPEIQTMRLKLFRNFLHQFPNPSMKELHDFLSQGNETENGFTMNRNEVVKTCSISIIEIDQQQATFEYFDLLNGHSNIHVVSLHASSSKIGSHNYSDGVLTGDTVLNNEISA